MTTTDNSPADDAAITHTTPPATKPAKAARKPRRMAREPKVDLEEGKPGSPTAPAPAAKARKPAAPRVTKSSAVIALLEREQGATIAELIEATGWLPHTTRAALTGLKKKGHAIARDKRGDVTCYHAAAKAE